MLTRREASTPRLRLGVLASLLVNIALKLHSEESKYTSATPRCTCFPPRATSTQVPLVQVQVPKSNSALPRWTWGLGLGLGGLERSQWWAPRATSAQVHRGKVQVQLGFASLYLDMALVDLSGVFGGHLVQLQLKSTAAKSRYNSASPRCTWTWPWWT